ncbi:hypothetical protein DL770_010068 [Monosporascus sp. CRB-9-2]|nr:hypothetical protein DL770_010068 [Monosporascus sp. CRB-9-2]
MAPTTTLKDVEFDLSLFESLMQRRFSFTESFEIYRFSANFNGDNRGLYDYGPPGCILQVSIVDLWRKHFVMEENMLELDCTVITLERVLETSGHVDKFADWMCKDPIKGEYLRADNLVKSVLEITTYSWGERAVQGSPKLDESTIAEYNDTLAKVTSNFGLD